MRRKLEKKTKLNRCIALLAAVMLLGVLIFPTACYAGINGPEAGLISKASGTFTYNGRKYKATSSALGKLRGYLAREDVDLTQAQANKAASMMYGNVGQGVSSGYLYLVGGGLTFDDDKEKKAKEEEEKNKVGDGTIDMSGNMEQYTIINENGDTIFESMFPVKNTGFSLAKPLAALAAAMVVAVILSAFIVRRRIRAPKVLLIAIAFLLATGGAFAIAGDDLTDYMHTKLAAAVSKGSPIYNFDGRESKVIDGQVARANIAIPSIGSRYGIIECDRIRLQTPLYFGDNEDILEKGAGQYTGSYLPGEGKTVLVGAHDIGAFAPLEKINENDVITLKTSYGTFKYDVNKIVKENADFYTAEDMESDSEQLVLYTCYPFGDVMHSSSQRYFVIADKISGPEVIDE